MQTSSSNCRTTEAPSGASPLIAPLQMQLIRFAGPDPPGTKGLLLAEVPPATPSWSSPFFDDWRPVHRAQHLSGEDLATAALRPE